MINRIQTSKQ